MPITGFPAVNDNDLIRDGFIETFLTRLYTDPDDIARLLSRPPSSGITLIPIRDEGGNVIELKERRKLLPAIKLQLEILFSKVLQGTGANPIDPGFAPLPSFGLFNPVTALIRGGGVTRIGTTEITYQLNDTQTIINRKLTVTQDMLDTGEIEFSGYPLSFFGIVKEHIEEEDIFDDEDNVVGTTVTKFGFDFTQEQLDHLGEFTSGQFEGGPRRSVAGATNSKGLFGGRGVVEVDIDNVLFPDQENLFVEIVRDIRKLKFRGDNPDASGERGFPYASNNQNDATDNKIKIKTTNLTDGTDLQVGDTIYLTYNVCRERRIRQVFRHRGQGFQDNSVGVSGDIGIILSTSDVFDFQLARWYVPKVIPDSISGFESEFKTPIDLYIKGKSPSKPDALKMLNDNNDIIEGWRWSEAVTERVGEFWAADYRGIIKVKDSSSEIIFPRKDIRDQVWFESYLDDLQVFGDVKLGSFDARTDIFENKFRTDKNNISGWLLDISEPTNTLVYDTEKLPYFRILARALARASDYSNIDDKTGVGVVALDLLNWLKKKENIFAWPDVVEIFPGSQFVKQFEFPDSLVLPLLDLSVLEFNSFSAVPLASGDCAEDTMLFDFHYPVDSVDAINGRGIFLTQSFVDNNFLEWRPPGGFLNSQWLLRTPYYCGEFTRKTRVYVEKVGGNTLDNFSTIYINAVPSTPSNIALDNHFYTDQATIAFRDDLFHDAVVYEKLHDGFLEEYLPFMQQDRAITHEPVEFDHIGNILIGANRFLGSTPSFSNGIPITDELGKICSGSKTGFFQESDLLDSSTDGFLDLLQGNPTLTLPDDWRVKEVTLEYDIIEESFIEEEKYLSIKFNGSDTVINNLAFPVYGSDNIVFTIDTKFYSGGPIEFISGIWKNLTLKAATLKYTAEDLLDIKVDSGQTATVYDHNGSLMIFYADDLSGNVSVAITPDEGNSWDKFTDIIRLVEGETATLPTVIRSADSVSLHLFWVLNDSFIMYTEIDTQLFNCEDIGVEYVPPKSYTSESDDDDSNNINSSLAKYSDDGKKLRRLTGYFVAGDGSDPFFEEQMETTQGIKDKNAENEEENLESGGDTLQSVRFDFAGIEEDLDQQYLGNSYSVFIDNGGLVRLFMMNNNKLTIRGSANFFTWFNQVKDIEIHKNFFGQKGIEETDLEVKSIQISRNPSDDSEFSLFYFHRGMLFMRNLQSNLMNIVQNEDGTLDSSIIEEELALNEGDGPIFLVGNIPQNIKDNLNDDELAIRFFYDSDMINNFDDKFAVDTDTQVATYIMREGLTRVLYKDNFGSLQSILISGFRPTLEVQNKPNDSITQQLA